MMVANSRYYSTVTVVPCTPVVKNSLTVPECIGVRKKNKEWDFSFSVQPSSLIATNVGRFALAGEPYLCQDRVPLYDQETCGKIVPTIMSFSEQVDCLPDKTTPFYKNPFLHSDPFPLGATPPREALVGVSEYQGAHIVQDLTKVVGRALGLSAFPKKRDCCGSQNLGASKEYDSLYRCIGGVIDKDLRELSFVQARELKSFPVSSHPFAVYESTHKLICTGETGDGGRAWSAETRLSIDSTIEGAGNDDYDDCYLQLNYHHAIPPTLPQVSQYMRPESIWWRRINWLLTPSSQSHDAVPRQSIISDDETRSVLEYEPWKPPFILTPFTVNPHYADQLRVIELLAPFSSELFAEYRTVDYEARFDEEESYSGNTVRRKDHPRTTSNSLESQLNTPFQNFVANTTLPTFTTWNSDQLQCGHGPTNRWLYIILGTIEMIPFSIIFGLYRVLLAAFRTVCSRIFFIGLSIILMVPAVVGLGIVINNIVMVNFTLDVLDIDLSPNQYARVVLIQTTAFMHTWAKDLTADKNILVERINAAFPG